jgi:intracellular sulfur oxidation DsrE/DsrF family protein
MKADAPHQGYEKVARMVNLLGTSGVTLHPGDLVVAVHGPPFEAMLTDAAYGKRHDGAANPSAGLLMALMKAGVELRLCGQTARGRGVTREDLLPGVKIDTSAITTMATLQLRGWAVIQD